MFEVTCHLTGIYPEWWTGRRFSGPTTWWLGGEDHNSIKEALQDRLLGPIDDLGSGFIPKHLIYWDTLKDAQRDSTSIKTFKVIHASGELSSCSFKSYKEGRRAWQAKPGTCILLDEEPPKAIYDEALTRTAVGDTMMMLTFTPMLGMSDVCMDFLQQDAMHPAGELSPSRYLVRASWDNCPHLTEEKKAALLRAYPKHLRDARSKGIPALGSGAIYKVPEDQVFIDPIEIPRHWKRAYGMDVGWNRTAALWGAIDPDSNVHYIYSEHYLGEEKPTVHAAAIRARGEWIPGAIDPAARGRGQDDGQKLFDQYADLGLKLTKADNEVTGPLWEIEEAMEQGRLKIFKTCQNTLAEFRIYRRDEKGAIVKKNDHAMDCLRYWWNTGRSIAVTEQKKINNPNLGRPTVRPAL